MVAALVADLSPSATTSKEVAPALAGDQVDVDRAASRERRQEELDGVVGSSPDPTGSTPPRAFVACNGRHRSSSGRRGGGRCRRRAGRGGRAASWAQGARNPRHARDATRLCERSTIGNGEGDKRTPPGRTSMLTLTENASAIVADHLPARPRRHGRSADHHGGPRRNPPSRSPPPCRASRATRSWSRAAPLSTSTRRPAEMLDDKVLDAAVDQSGRSSSPSHSRAETRRPVGWGPSPCSCVILRA